MKHEEHHPAVDATHPNKVETLVASADGSALSRVRRRPGANIRLVLADGHPLLLRGMTSLLGSLRDMDVVACCTRDDDLLSALALHQPDILVLDLHLPGRGSTALLRDLTERRSTTRVVLLAASITEYEMTDALRLGVRGVILKSMAADLLVQCIRHVHQGSVWLENDSAAGVIERMARRQKNMEELKRALTRRELQILQLAAKGVRNKDITTRLNITEGTVKIHLHNIYTKLGVKDRVQLILSARERALA